MVGKKNEGSELVAVLMYVQVEVLGEVMDLVGELMAVLTIVKVEVDGEVMDVIEVLGDKQVHKVRDEVTREVSDMEWPGESYFW